MNKMEKENYLIKLLDERLQKITVSISARRVPLIVLVRSAKLTHSQLMAVLYRLIAEGSVAHMRGYYLTNYGYLRLAAI